MKNDKIVGNIGGIQEEPIRMPDMTAHIAAKDYLVQPNTFAITNLREKYDGKTVIDGGKPYIVFPDGSTLSVSMIVRAKYPERSN